MKNILECITYFIAICTAISAIVAKANTNFLQRKLMASKDKILCELAQGIVIISIVTISFLAINYYISYDIWANLPIDIFLATIIWRGLDARANNKNVYIITNEKYRIKYAIDDQFLLCEKISGDKIEEKILSRQILDKAVIVKDKNGNYNIIY